MYKSCHHDLFYFAPLCFSFHPLTLISSMLTVFQSPVMFLTYLVPNPKGKKECLFSITQVESPGSAMIYPDSRGSSHMIIPKVVMGYRIVD